MKVSLVQLESLAAGEGGQHLEPARDRRGGQRAARRRAHVDTLMPDHGHKSTTVPQVTNKGAGDYR